MPRKPNKRALERALKHAESQARLRAKVAKRARTQTVHEAPPVAAAAAAATAAAGCLVGQGGPLFDSGSGGGIKDEDEDDDGSGGVNGGGLILRKAPNEGGQVILQRLTKSSNAKGTQLLRDAREIKRLKEELDLALKIDERAGIEPIALGLRVQEIKLEEVKREEGIGGNTGATSIKRCGFTNDHLQAEPACNAFLVALRHFTRSYVDTLDPLFHQEFRELLEKRQRGFDQLKEVVGQDQVRLFTPEWTTVRILDEGSRTTWQSWESDATPTLLIPFGPPVVLELEYGSVELEEGQFCLFDASLKHRIVLSTSTRNKRKRRQYVKDDGSLERPWCVCAFACVDMVGRGDGDDDEEEVDELEEEVAWVADEERMLEDPPEVCFKYRKFAIKP